MRIVVCILIFIVCTCCKVAAQYDILKDDSIVALLKNNYKSISDERIDLTTELMSRYLPSEPVFDSLKNKLVNDAETSRDRLLLCKTYNKIAQAYLNFTDKHEYSEKSKSFVDECLSIANESELDNYKVASYIQYAAYYRRTNNNQQALDYNNQAIALATSVGNDSLLCKAYSSISTTWYAMSNKLSCFQALLTAREFAEKSGLHDLITYNYIDLADFYNKTEQYEKSKDYYVLAINDGNAWKQYTAVLNAMRGLGITYAEDNQKELALMWYNKALSLSDSLGLRMYKVQMHIDLLNYYFNRETPEKGLAYLNSMPELMKFINDLGISYQLNKLYAAKAQRHKQFDSAIYYMNIAAPHEYEQVDNFGEKYNFTIEWAGILKDMGQYGERTKKLLLAKSFADSSADLDMLENISQQLDSAYAATGDYKNAYYYYSRYNYYKDTLDALGKQKDLLNIEIENTNKRAEQQKLKEEELVRQRNNIQYMGITAAIATVFIILVLLGVFRMSPAVIKALGFFAFIFLFEFITLLLDEQIHELTHGEPWKVLAIKIVLIAMLLPLHHWLEEKVLHYLTSKAHKLSANIRIFHRASEEKVH